MKKRKGLNKSEEIIKENNYEKDKENNEALIIIDDLTDEIKVNGFIYKKNKRYKYVKSSDPILAIYKCKFNRKDEKKRNQKNLGSFCNGTCIIKKRFINNTYKNIIIDSNPHSDECINFQNNKLNKNHNEKIIEDYKNFKDKVFEYLSSIEIYDRKICKEKIQELYNSKAYNFELKKSTIINLINKFKDSSIKFTKYQALEDPFDSDKELFLRDHRLVFKEDFKHSNNQELEYFIWGNNLNIAHLRKSETLFIDGTFHVPYGFHQTLVIMYKDIITGEKYPCFYILMNKKNSLLYDLIFRSVITIITQNDLYPIITKNIITDAESALLSSIKKYFKQTSNFICLYHFKKDLLDNARVMGLLKGDIKEETKILINELVKLAINYNGNLNYVNSKIKELKDKNKKFINL